MHPLKDLGYIYNRTTKKYQLTNNKLKNIKPNVLFFSGCKDEQTSADAYLRELGEFGGAFTDSLLDKDWLKRDIFDLLEDDKTDISHIMDKINNYMIMNSFTQRPCLSTNMSNIIIENDYLDNIDILNHFFIDKEPNNNIDFILPNTNSELSPISSNPQNNNELSPISSNLQNNNELSPISSNPQNITTVNDINLEDWDSDHTPISTNNESYISIICNWVKNKLYNLIIKYIY